MPADFAISLSKLVEDNAYEYLHRPEQAARVSICSKEVARPSLVLAGFPAHFNAERVQFLGSAELSYLSSLSEPVQAKRLKTLCSLRPVALVVAHSNPCPPKLIKLAKEYDVPLLATQETTSDSMAWLISYLGVELADRVTRHGVLVEVYGQGVLILGESGVGKSETAVELIKRGHRLVADDAVEISRISNKTLVGSAPYNTRHFVELRGVGIINARRIFGMGAVKLTEKINMVIQLQPWDENQVYDRLGLDEQTVEILGIPVPICIIPVKPGRNLSIVIEAAALNNRQKLMGYNAAQELLKQLGMVDEVVPEQRELDVWEKN